jgi:hypothetical protein
VKTLHYPDARALVRGFTDGTDERRAKEASDVPDERDGALEPAPPRVGA